MEEIAVLKERAQRDQITIKELREAFERQKMVLVSAFEEDCRYIYQRQIRGDVWWEEGVFVFTLEAFFGPLKIISGT